MAKNKSYAVVKGLKPGIYNEWFGVHGAEAQIKGFAGAVFKGFASHNEAEEWFKEKSAAAHHKPADHALKAKIRKEAPGKPKPRLEESEEHLHKTTEGKAILYTDGGCSRNPGPGGYGAVLLLGDQRKELSGGYARTTNNRMELMGCIKGLEAIGRKCPVLIHTDSQYVVNGIEKGWAKRWKKNNWMRNSADKAENADLWELLLALCEKADVKFVWVRGHNGDRENERCDTLAVEMTQRVDLPPDYGYSEK